MQSIAEQEASKGTDVRHDDAEDDAAVSQQELNGLREGFAQHGEAWLRERLQEQSFPQMHGLAGAAGLPRYSGRRKLSKEELEPALWRSIAEQEASERMDVRDDDAEGGDHCRGVGVCVCVCMLRCAIR